MASDQIGQLRWASIRNEQPAESDHEGWRVNPEISGGRHFVDLGSDILDSLDWLLGPVTNAAGIVTEPKTWSLAPSALVRCRRCRCLELRLVPSQDQVEIVGTARALSLLASPQDASRVRTERRAEQIKTNGVCRRCSPSSTSTLAGSSAQRSPEWPTPCAGSAEAASHFSWVMSAAPCRPTATTYAAYQASQFESPRLHTFSPFAITSRRARPAKSLHPDRTWAVSCPRLVT
jgi:hypothetical protein